MRDETAVHRPAARALQTGHYEYRVMSIPRTTSRHDASRMLTEEAEYGHWELARAVLYAGGERKVWLRRKIIRVRSTLGLTGD